MYKKHIKQDHANLVKQNKTKQDKYSAAGKTKKSGAVICLKSSSLEVLEP